MFITHRLNVMHASVNFHKYIPYGLGVNGPHTVYYMELSRALEILKSESVQPMTLTSAMSPKCIYHLSRKLMTIGSPITPFN